MTLLVCLLTLQLAQEPSEPAKPEPTKPEPRKITFSPTDPNEALHWCALLAKPGEQLAENAVARQRFLEQLHRTFSSQKGRRITWPLKVEAVAPKVLVPQPVKVEDHTLFLVLLDRDGKKQEMLHQNATWVGELKKHDWFFIHGTVVDIRQDGKNTFVTLKPWQLLPAKKQ